MWLWQCCNGSGIGGDDDDGDDVSGGVVVVFVVFSPVDRDISFGPILLTASNRLMHSFDLRVILAANVEQ